ncbi:peptidylprolyl isomerase [Ferruginibacter paludis]|uniref:foldase protein PrsA n=1 Tax=Ferruginibacter paludis TaxID=1310417 RepID=UPI0025B34D43|nr:peptidylprolyl isomerase [Ferruginibacter paludis]MDN3658629.1 peptidylprolyl isomerase [Ferruginibacter paludis]
MKYFFLLLVLSFFSVHLLSQTLFTYGNEKVSKEEFLRAYHKNKTPVDDKEKSLREYLELYSKFKLKVKAAKQLRLDTLQQLKYDLQNFSSQVEEGYMNDEKISNALLDEVIERSQKDIHLIHFYTPLAAGANAADSAKASKAMEELVAELQKGSTDYAAIANAISQKYVAVTAKDIGYITALSLPYGMENLVYGLQPGTISKPYRTKNGLHVFKNAGERKSAGKWKIAQILFTLPPDASAAQIKETEKKADSVYALLKAGADFGEMAKKFSEDRLTALNGGEMAEFGTGKFDMPFESKVFELEKDGDISKPFSTTHGFHIVKRLQQHAIPADKTDETFVAALKQQMAKDARMNIAKDKFLKDITALTNYKRNVLVKDAELFRYADSVVANKTVKNYPVSNKIIISFTKENIKGNAWLNFVKDYKLNTDVYKQETNKELLDKFIATTITEYYRKHLGEYNNSFKYQMQEFKEGNMLFEIMERKVWARASEDSIELKKYYDAHKASYKWDSSAAILLFNCSDSSVARKAIAEVKNGKDWKKIAEESDGKIQSDSGRYELSQLQLQNTKDIVPGFISSPVTNSGDNTASFVKVLQLFPANQQRSFNDARGLVINEYQIYLEDKWVSELKKQYPVKVDEGVFKSLLK